MILEIFLRYYDGFLMDRFMIATLQWSLLPGKYISGNQGTVDLVTYHVVKDVDRNKVQCC